MPRPISFCEHANLRITPEEIASNILDLSKWPEFDGYMLLPGIERAEFEKRTDEIVGTRIAVTNTDGSTHTEEIVAWEPDSHLALRLEGFSKPLNYLADSFDEEWSFELREDGYTNAIRCFKLYPKSVLARVLLLPISKMLRGAVKKHMTRLAAEHK